MAPSRYTGTMHVTLIRCDRYQHQRWKNGLGWTREIIREPADEERFDWRISLADIDHDCPFSAFPDYRRSLLLLQGSGMVLGFRDGRECLLDQSLARIDFDGSDAPDCRLLAGPTRDFNLMWKPKRVRASLEHHAHGEPLHLSGTPATRWIIHVLNGWTAIGATPDADRALAGDTLALAEASRPSENIALHGAGEILLVRLDMLDPAW